MRRLAQQILDLLRKRAWFRQSPKVRGQSTLRLHLESLEDRFLPATSVNQLLPAALTGTAFIDHNHNNVLDPGEVVLPGATVTLSGKDLQGNSVSAKAVTDANGVYKFLEVNPGTYKVSLSTNANFLGSGAGAGSQGGIVSGSVVSSISIAQGQTLVGYNLAVEGLSTSGVSLRQFLSTTILVNGIPTYGGSSVTGTAGTGLGYADGGAAPPAILTAAGTGSLAGTVANTTGTGIANVTIGLTGITGGGANGGLPTFTTTTTNTSGAYTFSNLAAGSYTINVVSQPPAFRAGTPALGSLDGYIRQNDTLAGINVTTTAGTGYNFTEIPVTGPTVGSTPAMEAHLVDDTAGASGTTSDAITSDPTIAGVIANVGKVTSFTGALDGGSAVSLPSPNANGSFLLSRALLNQLATGGVLADGAHTVQLSVTGTAGTTSATVSFTLLSSVLVPTAHLDTTSDPAQDGRPIQNAVTILGTTSPNAEVELLAGTSFVASTNSNASGNFSFAQTLVTGPNNFIIHVTDNAGNQSQAQVSYVIDQAPTATTISNVTVNVGAANQILDLAQDFTDPDTSDTILQFQTAMGNINVQLNDAQDPQTVRNFLDYIKSGAFTNSIFHRSVSGFVLQGGGFTLSATTPLTINPVVTGAPVASEAPATPPTGGSNIRGTIAMALSSGPATGTSQYFFNLANNSSTLDGTTDGGPFTVFATIADGFSQRIVDNLASIPVTDESSAPGTAINAVQNVTVNGAPTGGTFTLNLSGTASTPIAFNATASAVQAAVAGLPSPKGTGTIGAANVTVTGSPGAWTITFVGNLAGTSVPTLTSFSNLTGGNSPSATVAVVTAGAAANSALTNLPLQNYTGTNFPTDATDANFALIQSVQILQNTEFLTYSVTGNTNPAVASATLDPTFNNNLTLQFLTAGTTSITVTATDLSGKTASTTFSVTVNAAASNQAPVIAAQNFTVAQGAASGTQIGVVQAKDPDVGQTLTYAITAGNTNSTFAINSATGQLTVANITDLTLANSPFNLTVQVTDNGSPALSSSATITVKIVNGAPTIANQTFTAAAGSATGTVLGTVAATSAPGQVLTYAITGGNANNALQINSATGQLSVNTSSALTVASSPIAITVTVTATNATPTTASATMTVNVVPEQAPTIAAQTFNIPSNAANGAVVGTVQASAAGTGQTLTYAITGGNTGTTFQIDPATGIITVANSAIINTTAFNLTVQVTDNNTTPSSNSATVTVNVANTQPAIANQFFSVIDGSPNGTVVGTVLASDADIGQSLTYAITGGNTGNTFQIDPATGIITVADNTVLNMAANPTFALTVQVTDNGVPAKSNSATMTITLTANNPPNISDQSFSVTPGSANGTIVGTVVASDPDQGQSLTYAISAGNTNSTFAINSATGQLTVADNTDLTLANSPFSLTVQVTDNDKTPLSSSATITVNGAPSIANQTFTAAAGSATGTVLGTVAATGAPGQVLTYAITGGNANNALQINSATGQLSVNTSSAVAVANSPITATVTVTATNASPAAASATMTVNVVPEQAPTIAAQTFNIPSNSANGTAVGTVQARAAGVGQTLTYAITGGNTGNTFQINSATGAITVANNAVINTTAFNLTVQVTDNNTTPMNNTATVTINVANDPPAIVNQTFSVTDGSPNGTVVGTVAASDPDVGQSLTYAIASGNTGNTFQINSATGQITVADNTVLNVASNPSFALKVVVTDNGFPSMNTAAIMTINLTANNPPSISNQSFSVPAGSANGTAVGTVVASDPDQGQSVTYAITAGNTNSTFAINSATGQITVADNTDLTLANSPFTLTVQATDNDKTPLSTSATITVTLT